MTLKMGKYDALGRYLRAQPANHVPMTFGEIERVLGIQLPLSARKHRPWWSNNPRNSVMTQVWLDAGFETEQVDMARGTLVFRRVGEARAAEVAAPRPQLQSGEQAPPVARRARQHPLFGALKALVRVAPGVDLTEPADVGPGGAQ
jgi:hypothetical protein